MPKSPLQRSPQFADHRVGDHTFRVARWRASGESGAPPLLFFTGIGANIELLAPFLERLHERDVITFDMPGLGGTPAYASPYRLSAMARAASGILDQLGCGGVDVMGVSWGGMLAQEFAYRYPQRIERLVLAATSAGFPMVPGKLSTLIRMVNPQRYANPATMGPFLQSLYGGSDVGLGSYTARMSAPSSTGYLHQILAIAGWTSARKLTGVRAKTLVLMGNEDRLVPPANGHILKFLLQDGRLEFFDDAGHLFILTHADQVLQTINGFLGARSEPRPFPLRDNGLRPLAV
jgi:poly(3-hydroxyalkanoate) depolymerase